MSKSYKFGSITFGRGSELEGYVDRVVRELLPETRQALLEEVTELEEYMEQTNKQLPDLRRRAQHIIRWVENRNPRGGTARTEGSKGVQPLSTSISSSRKKIFSESTLILGGGVFYPVS